MLVGAVQGVSAFEYFVVVITGVSGAIALENKDLTYYIYKENNV
ncbi:hypothetical protein [Bacillus sinesaloumensis]|nr:hypothetical protein [Bacillus sinesaloumensis]